MSLRKALGWSSIQTVVRIGLGFVSAKISAIYLGPSGVALVGQVTSFLQLTQGAIGNAAGTAVVNLTAERRAESERLNVLWATALRLVWVMALSTLLVIAGVSQPLSSWLLGDAQYWPALLLSGIAVVLVVTDTVITASLNGLQQVNLIAKTSIVSAFVEVAIFASLVYSFGLWGGLIGSAAIYAGKLMVTCIAAYRSGFLTTAIVTKAFDSLTAHDIAKFYPMLIAHSIALPLAQILVRGSVIDELGLVTGGYLQAVWRLSDMYVGVLTTALGLFFMAQYSSLSSDHERGKVLRKTVLQMMVLTSLAAMSLYLIRDFVITLVLTKEFLPMGELLPFHLLGDVFKLMDYPLQMALVAQRRMYWYLAQAAGGPALFAALTALMLPSFGPQAAPMSYAISFVAVFVVLVYASRNLLFSRKSFFGSE